VGTIRKSTIYDVARRARVNTTTVTYFLNGRLDICSAVTAERIRVAIAELDFTRSAPSIGAQAHVKHTIGSCIFSSWSPDLHYGSFFFERIWNGIFDKANSSSCSILKLPTLDAQDYPYDALLEGSVDGVIFHAHTDENEVAALVAAAGLPIVLMTRSINIPVGCGAAYIDEHSVVSVALSRLWELGHRRIAHIAGPVGPDVSEFQDDSAIQRKDAYVAWMAEHQATDPELLYSSSSWFGSDVNDVVTRWRSLPSPPTAILCANDDLAISTIRVARSLRWSVPNDVSVVGIDNRDDKDTWQYQLTSIDPHLHKVGREAVAGVVRIIEGEKPENVRIAITGADWIERGTVANPAGKPSH